MTDTAYDESGQPVSGTFAPIEKTVKAEVKAAKEYTERVQSADRIKRWDRYYGKPYGNERAGRSKYVSKDIMETVEWILPSLMSTFVSSDPKVAIEIEGQPPVVGKAIMEKIQQDLNDDDERSLYILFYQWFKDALVSDTAFVTQSWQFETFLEEMVLPRASTQQMADITGSPNSTLVAYTDNMDGSYSDVEIAVERVVKNRLNVDNIPHWDVLVSENAKYINDEFGKGYKATVTLDYLERVNEEYTEGEEPFFDNLDRLNKFAGKKSDGFDDSEKSNYMGEEESSRTDVIPGAELDDEELDPKTQLELVQWYDRIDIDGDGKLENVRCWLAEGEVLLRYEENVDDAIMISALSPIIDCYKMFGIAYSELIIDIQNLNTMIMRRILDNFDFSTLGRTFVRPGGAVPVKEMLDQIPGDVLFVDPGAVSIEYPKPFDGRALQLMEYVNQIKENRTGSTRYTQGTDAESLNKTVGGISMLQQASQKRIDMIARLFAETGLRDLYKKCVILYRNNLSEPFTVTVDGRPVTVNPDQLQGRIKCKANLGIESQIGMMEAQRIQQIFAFLVQINQMFPGIISPEQIHNMAVEYVANMGKKQPENYVAVIQQFGQSLQQAQQKTEQMRNFEMQLKQQEMQIKWAEVEIEAKKLGVDMQEIASNFEGRMATKEMDISQRQQSDMLNFVAEMAKINSQPKVVPAGAK